MEQQQQQQQNETNKYRKEEEEEEEEENEAESEREICCCTLSIDKRHLTDLIECSEFGPVSRVLKDDAISSQESCESLWDNPGHDPVSAPEAMKRQLATSQWGMRQVGIWDSLKNLQRICGRILEMST